MTEINRDRWGRPLVPDPATGQVRAWTRVTTLAGTIDDRYGLEQWAKRNVVKGFAAREDLLVRAVAAGNDRDQLTQVVEAAEEAARASAAAEIGTALHTITARIDAGEKVDLPASLRPNIDAYRAAIGQAKLTIVPGWIERFVVIPELDAAGTADRLYAPYELGLPMVGDIKTGADVLRYNQVKIAAQLAIYSRATHWYDGRELHEMPKVDQGMGIVAHMPAGSGRCSLYAVDLHRGWELACFCHQARQMRKSDGLLQPVASHEVSNAELDAELRARIKEIVRALDGAPLPLPWPAHIDPPKRHPNPYSHPELEQIERWCDRVAPATSVPPF